MSKEKDKEIPEPSGEVSVILGPLRKSKGASVLFRDEEGNPYVEGISTAGEVFDSQGERFPWNTVRKAMAEFNGSAIAGHPPEGEVPKTVGKAVLTTFDEEAKTVFNRIRISPTARVKKSGTLLIDECEAGNINSLSIDGVRIPGTTQKVAKGYETTGLHVLHIALVGQATGDQSGANPMTHLRIAKSEKGVAELIEENPFLLEEEPAAVTAKVAKGDEDLSTAQISTAADILCQLRWLIADEKWEAAIAGKDAPDLAPLMTSFQALLAFIGMEAAEVSAAAAGGASLGAEVMKSIKALDTDLKEGLRNLSRRTLTFENGRDLVVAMDDAVGRRLAKSLGELKDAQDANAKAASVRIEALEKVVKGYGAQTIAGTPPASMPADHIAAHNGEIVGSRKSYLAELTALAKQAPKNVNASDWMAGIVRGL